VSRNFELMRQAGKGIGDRKRPLVAVDTHENSVTHLAAPWPGHDERKAFDWQQAKGILQKHWRLSAIFAAVVMLVVIGVNVFTQPVYESTAHVEIDPSGEKFSLDNSGGGVMDTEYLETQSQIMQGDSLAIAVIRNLRLDQNPQVVGKLDAEDLKPAVLASSGQQLTPAEGIALSKFKDSLKVKRDTASRLILVSFTSPDPQLAAQVPNALVQAFIDQSFQTRHDAVLKSSEWLSRQLDDIRKKMEDSSQALTQYQQASGVTDIDSNKSTFTEHMGELSRQQTLAQAERIQIQSLLKNAANTDSLPEVRSNQVVQQLSQRLAEQRAALAQALVVYGSNHPTAQRLQTEVDELQSQIELQKKAIVNSLRASYASAAVRESMMAAEMKGTGKELDKVARYTSLKKEVEANEALYNTLYARIKEAGIAAASKSADIQVVDPARIPDEPVRPRRLLNLAVGLMISLIGGVGLAFLFEEFDDKLRSPDDVRRWMGSLNVSVIPAITETSSVKLLTGWSEKVVGALPAPNEDRGKDMFFLERPNSPEGEALQALYASIMLSWPNNPPQTLLIVSALPGEGKTTVALNLSCVLAQHANTCLVDADLRKGRVARAFNLSSGQGLGDVLGGQATIEASVLEVPGISNLSILPAGRSKGNFGQLVCSEKMEETVSRLRERFGFIVIDSAPILPFVDSRALSTLVDAVVLVGRAGVTTRKAMRRSVELISEVHGAPILQIVLNAASVGTDDYKYYQYGYENYSTTK
jgi:polysaccharide biosynthesis transport protein